MAAVNCGQTLPVLLLVYSSVMTVFGGGVSPYRCPVEMDLTYLLGHNLPSLKEFGLTEEECFDRLSVHKDWTDNIIYCPQRYFCGTNLTLHFLNSFPPVTKQEERECFLYSTSNFGCESLENLISGSDENECAVTMEGCGPCENFVGGYWCNCVHGYEPDETEHNCLDVDECHKFPEKCSPNSQCSNLRGSFECECNTGFQGNGTICDDVDECLNTRSCHFNAICTNTQGSFSCACKPGYEGSDCQDIDECATNRDNCNDATSFCLNHEGTFECACKVGFDASGGGCEDYNECLHPGEFNCPDNSDCVNLPGNYTCRCHDFYYGNHLRCLDIDECDYTKNPQEVCGSREKGRCDNYQFPYACTCFPGYKSIVDPCVGDAQCSNFECLDIDECALENPSKCHETANCVNSEGSYSCECPTDYNPKINSAGQLKCLSKVIHLAQFVHTDMALGSKRVTSIEKKSIPESDTNYDVRMKLYSKNPRVTSSEYIEISIYTKIFYFVSDAFTVSEVLDAAREAAQNTLGGLPNNLISGGSDSDQASTEEPIEPKTSRTKLNCTMTNGTSYVNFTDSINGTSSNDTDLNCTNVDDIETTTPIVYWGQNYTVPVIYRKTRPLTSDEQEDLTLLGSFFVCRRLGCSGDLLKICELDDGFMTLFKGSDSKCTSTWGGSMSDLKFYDEVPDL